MNHSQLNHSHVPSAFDAMRKIFMFLAPIIAWNVSSAQSCRLVMMENISVSATSNKVGFAECCTDGSPPKYYLIQTYSTSWNYSDPDGALSESETFITTIARYPRPTTCTPPSVGGDDFLGTSTVTCGAGSASCPDNPTGVLQPDCSWSDATCAGYINTKETAIGGDPSWHVTSYSCSPNYKDTAEAAGQFDWTANSDITYQLSSELKDSDLRSDCIGGLAPLQPPWASDSGTAQWTLDANHFCGTAGKMQYRVKIPSSEKDTVYTVSWTEVTTFPDGSSRTQPRREDLNGTGDPVNPVVGSTHLVDVPSTPCTITETLPMITSQRSRNTPSYYSPPGVGGAGAQ